MSPEDYERALARLPKWMLALALIGAVAAFLMAGLTGVSGFLLGALGAWFNLRLVERGVNRLVRAVSEDPGRERAATGYGIFIQFALFIALAFVILRFTGFNLKAAMLGFLVCPAAAVIEIGYELFDFRH